MYSVGGKDKQSEQKTIILLENIKILAKRKEAFIKQYSTKMITFIRLNRVITFDKQQYLDMYPTEPRYIDIENTNHIVIFIHGIVEGPDQFTQLIDISVAMGYAAAALLLPGHGGSGKDFARHNKETWQEHVRQQIDYYRKRYTNIILVGHSMGSLLSLLAYTEDTKQIRGIIVIDTPLYVRVKWRAIRNNLKIGFCSHIPEDDPAFALLQASSVAPCSVFRYLTWAPRIIDLFHLMARTRKILQKINIPTLVIHADRDELVSTSSVQVFEHKLPKSYQVIIRLPHSTHFRYAKEDLDTLHTHFRQFIQNLNL